MSESFLYYFRTIFRCFFIFMYYFITLIEKEVLLLNTQPSITSKARLLLLAPYTGLKVLFENIVHEYSMIELTAYVSDTREAAGFVTSLDLSQYDIIISRGYTCDLIERACKRHVLDVGISIYDVLTSIKLAHNYNGKYVFVGFQSVIYLAKVLKDILKYDFDVYTVENIQQIEPTLLRLKELGYSMIVGDVVTTNAANRIGLQSILINTSEESVRKTLKESIEIFNEKKMLYEEVGFHKLIEQNLHHTHIAVFDSEHLLSASFELSRELLALMQANVTTTLQNQSSYFLRNLDSTQYSIHGKVVTHQSRNLVVYTIKEQQSTDTPVMIKFINPSDELIVSQRLFYSLNASMQKILHGIQSFKYYTRPILIKGPLYSGKSEIAKYIYHSNTKQNGPLIIINCNRFQSREWDQFLNKDSSPLYSSEATLFFQSVSQLSIDCQKQLLYYLDSSNAWKRNQIIFSTGNTKQDENADYFEEEFLRDFRPLVLLIPSLKERKEDIPNLATLYLNDFITELAKPAVSFTSEAIQILEDYSWPGNLIQFQNVIRKAMLLSSDFYISKEDTLEALREYETEHQTSLSLNSLYGSLSDITKGIIQKVLEEEGYNQSKAASRLKISRGTLRRHLEM